MTAYLHMHMSFSSIYRGCIYETKNCTVFLYVAMEYWKCDWNLSHVIKTLMTVQLNAMTAVTSSHTKTCSCSYWKIIWDLTWSFNVTHA